MAVIDSRTAGVLRPGDSENTGEVETRLRLFVSDVTGLEAKLVRQRWLPKPGTQPSLEVSWCAVGIVGIKTWGLPYIRGRKGTISDPASGDVKSEAHQTMQCMASFYGPQAQELADIFRSGARLPQNNDYLQSMGLSIQGVDDDIRHQPDFQLQQWVDRYDVSFRVGRKVSRTYGVRTIASADVEIITERGKL
ncbi:MAG TPA: hypothetical protein IAC66_07540 [Candidatus Aphodousia gallistercoris]|nr:hypothetical protein [Candidatus Aphodousia gallistercoris]